jgi:hypothetical protein
MKGFVGIMDNESGVAQGVRSSPVEYALCLITEGASAFWRKFHGASKADCQNERKRRSGESEKGRNNKEVKARRR